MAYSSFITTYEFEFVYDVFISFRGADTRAGFTGHLHRALRSNNIKSFMDDQDLKKGAEINPALEKAIQNSLIALVILSKNYASSSFCLEELVKIMVCSKDKGMLVLPVFYQVDPSDVRHLKGTYAKAFKKHKSRIDKDKIQNWSLALNKVADLSGWHFNGGKFEYEVIDSIVDYILKRIQRDRDKYTTQHDKQEEAPSTPQHPLSALGEACSRMDLTAIHQILVASHYRDDEGTNKELSFDVWTQHMRDMLEVRNRGDYAFRDKDFKTAIDYYSQFIYEGTVVSPTVFARLSICYLLCDQPDSALLDAMRAQCVHTEWPTAFYMQSVALAMMDMHKDAIDMFNEATALEEKRQREGGGS